MSFFFSKPNSRHDVIQIRLIRLVVFFHLIGCILLTLAPAVRFHSWSAELRWHQWIGFIVWFIGFLFLHRVLLKHLPDRDPYLLPIISFLSAWGLLTIYRLDFNFGLRQTAWLAIGLLLGYLAIRSKGLLNFIRRYRYVWLSGGLLLTLLTFVVGVYPNGTGPALWLSFFGVYLQPSEILKILLVVFLASYLADNLRVRFNLLQLLLPTLILVGAAFLILVAQHDLGTASLFIAVYAVIIYLASGKKRLLLISMIVVLIAIIAGYLIYDVIQLRIEAWLNPWLDSNGRSYQIVQSIIAVANGGIFGRGIGLGSPGVVPVAHSDFIFPAIFEETGLLGAAGLVLLFTFFMIRGFSIALNAPNQFQRFLAAGLTTTITVQALLIIGGSIRLLPLTGVTLPFVSYGGSSLVTSFVAAFLLLIISNNSETQPAVLDRGQPYRMVGGVFLTSFAALFLLSTWWSVIRSDDLLSRNDNPRRSISDNYVIRGSIFDQNDQLLASTTGETGNYIRKLAYPPLSSVIGYTDANYGQAGLEASQDNRLRGVSSTNFWQVFTTRLLYGQYPQGFDLRTSLDLGLQEKVDSLLGQNKGSVLVMNAESGEILAMATSPTFDANSLAGNMEIWKTDPNSPLLNRATQGVYPPGSITGGLIYNLFASNGSELPELPAFYQSEILNGTYYCAGNIESTYSWLDLIAAGCPLALEKFSSGMKPVEIYNLYIQYGLLNQPDIPIERAAPASLESFSNLENLFRGQSNLLVSPLQVAISYAPFSNGGFSIEPSLTTSFRNTDGEWLLLTNSSKKEKMDLDFSTTVNHLTSKGSSGWSLSATVPTESGRLDWYVQGTPLNWRGVPIILVVALEDSSPVSAAKIGSSIYLIATNQK